jgi:hypothetical protein
MAKWIMKGDLVEFRVVSAYPKHQAMWAPKRRFDWRDMRSKPRIILECNRAYTGLVVDTYLVGRSRHVERSFKPTAKKQPGKKQRYLQEISKERVYHILSEDVILYIHASDLRSSGANAFQWEMRVIQEGQAHGKR